MKVDPNRMVGMVAEWILCEDGFVILHDNSMVSMEAIEDADGAFAGFLKSIDPNRTFIIACVPDNKDDEVFFRARDFASTLGVHMQAPKDKAETLRQRWKAYCQAKQHAEPEVERELSGT